MLYPEDVNDVQKNIENRIVYKLINLLYYKIINIESFKTLF